MTHLTPTPAHRLLDAQGRPYFLWDVDLTMDAWRAKLEDADPAVRAYALAKAMRQAKPDDVLVYVGAQHIADALPDLEPYLGEQRAFWTWLVATWRRLGVVDG